MMPRHLLAVREALATLLVDPTPAQREAAVTVLSSFSDQPCTDAELRDLLAAVDLSDLQPRLATIAPVLNEQGKEHLLAACTRVVATGGVIDGQTRAKIEEIGSGLLMTPAHVRGVIDQVLEAARA
jgi:hypothetical protein